MVALGAAIENLVLAAHEKGLEVNIKYLLQNDEDYLVASASFYRTKGAMAETETHLYDELQKGISARKTNRNLEPKTSLSPSALQSLADLAASENNFSLKIITDEPVIQSISDIVASAERIRLLHPRGHSDFVKEVRWTDKENLEKRDGVDLETVDMTASEKAALTIAKDNKPIDFIRRLNKGRAFEKMSRKTLDLAPAVGLLIAENGVDFIKAGRVLERIWIKANMSGLSVHPVSPCTFLFERLNQNALEGFTSEMVEELKMLNKHFISIFDLHKDRKAVFLFKLFSGKKDVKPSLRKALGDVLITK
jgi:hypothetical protein